MPRFYAKDRCQAITERGTQCKRRAEVNGPCGERLCYQHCDMARSGDEIELVEPRYERASAEPLMCKRVCEGEYARGLQDGRSGNFGSRNPKMASYFIPEAPPNPQFSSQPSALQRALSNHKLRHVSKEPDLTHYKTTDNYVPTGMYSSEPIQLITQQNSSQPESQSTTQQSAGEETGLLGTAGNFFDQIHGQ